MREGHSLSGSRVASSSLEQFNSEWGASSTTFSFPFRLEEPSLFASDMKKVLGDVCGGMREETKRRMRERSCKREKELCEIKSKIGICTNIWKGSDKIVIKRGNALNEAETLLQNN